MEDKGQRGSTGINVFDLPDGNIKELDHILGHKVKVKIKGGGEIIGKLQFVGTNALLPSWGLHCTIDRVPGICINSIMDIIDLEPQEEA